MTSKEVSEQRIDEFNTEWVELKKQVRKYLAKSSKSPTVDEETSTAVVQTSKTMPHRTSSAEVQQASTIVERQASPKVAERTPLSTSVANKKTSPIVADSLTYEATLQNSPIVLEKPTSIECEHADPINSLEIMQISFVMADICSLGTSSNRNSPTSGILTGEERI